MFGKLLASDTMTRWCVMINVLQLAAGRGSRFKDSYDEPKPFIKIGGKPMFLVCYESLNLNPSNTRYHFVCQESHLEKYDPKLYCEDMIVHSIDHYTDGAATTAYNVINNNEYKNEPWLIVDCDFVVSYSTDVTNLTTSAIFNQYYPWDVKSSYSVIHAGNILAVAEKQPISKYRNTGQYFFVTGELFNEAYIFYKNENIRPAGEFYIAPLYNYLIQTGHTVCSIEVDDYHAIGTPEDLHTYNERNNYI